MKRNITIALLAAIMLLAMAAAFIASDVYIGKLMTSLGIISGVFCSAQLIKSHES